MRRDLWGDFKAPAGARWQIETFSWGTLGGGPRILVTGGIHGGEVTFWIFRELAKVFSSASQPQGLITLVPFANPQSWLQRSYFTTAGKFSFVNGCDWNRLFPGREDGSFEQRWAKVLFDNAATYDYVIDLHTSRKSVPFTIVTHERSMPLAQTLGVPLIFHDTDPQGRYAQAFGNQLDVRGIPNVTIECGSHDTFSEIHIREVSSAICRVLSSIPSSPDSQSAAAKPLVFSRTHEVRSPISGIFTTHVIPGMRVVAGESIGTVAASLQDEVSVLAPHEMLILKTSPTYVVYEGELLFEGVPHE